ncbi:putative manganese efflux pump MntP [Clostridia bacterium]|nr:putative manganese efflux pump MntP [Clostridia bacterium]
MNLWEIVLLALALSMDAFAVSVVKGCALRKVNVRVALAAGIWFGAFQALMPLIGYALRSSISGVTGSFDHWIAFVLLVYIGGKMLWDAFRKESDAPDTAASDISVKVMLPLAIATSIDALAVGITLATFQISSIALTIALIGVITFTLSSAGVFIGAKFGAKLHNKATALGGTILILLGVKVLVEHLIA